MFQFDDLRPACVLYQLERDYYFPEIADQIHLLVGRVQWQCIYGDYLRGLKGGNTLIK